MTFHIYHKVNDKIEKTDKEFSLAGYNLIFDIWKVKNNPFNGWHISQGELQNAQKQKDTSLVQDDLRFVIDYHPQSKERIGLLEILDIYVYSFKDTSGGVEWSPLMLKLGNFYYIEGAENKANVSNKESLIKSLPEKKYREQEIITEFLYLKSWNWGRNGMTNAVFLHQETLEYFKKYI